MARSKATARRPVVRPSEDILRVGKTKDDRTVRLVDFDATKTYWQFLWISEEGRLRRVVLFDPLSEPNAQHKENMIEDFRGGGLTAAEIFEDLSPEQDLESGPDFLSGDWCYAPDGDEEGETVKTSRTITVYDS